MKGELEVESQEAQDFLNYMIPEFFKDGVGIINDLVKSWRWKNQINILQKSKKFLEEKKIGIIRSTIKNIDSSFGKIFFRRR